MTRAKIRKLAPINPAETHHPGITLYMASGVGRQKTLSQLLAGYVDPRDSISDYVAHGALSRL